MPSQAPNLNDQHLPLEYPQGYASRMRFGVAWGRFMKGNWGSQLHASAPANGDKKLVFFLMPDTGSSSERRYCLETCMEAAHGQSRGRKIPGAGLIGYRKLVDLGRRSPRDPGPHIETNYPSLGDERQRWTKRSRSMVWKESSSARVDKNRWAGPASRPHRLRPACL